MDLKKDLQPVGRNDMEYIKEEQRDTVTRVRTSNVHISLRGENEGTETTLD